METLIPYGYFIGIIILTILVAFLVNKFFIQLIRKSTDDIQNDPTNYKFFRRAIVALLYAVGFGAAIYTLPELRALASSLLAGAGILAVAIGFASQQALGNIISGFFIIIFKPFRVNDRLTLKGMTGIVEDITLRHTVIRNYENKRIIIPNSMISEEVIINSDFGDGKICKWIDINVSYDTDITLAKKLLREEVMAHPLLIDHRDEEQIKAGEEQVVVRVIALGDYAILLRAWAWTLGQTDAFVLACDLNERIKQRFDKENVEIPYPHQKLIVQNKS